MKPINLLEITREQLKFAWKTSLSGFKIPDKMYPVCNAKGMVKDWKKVLVYYPQELPFLRKKRKVNIIIL